MCLFSFVFLVGVDFFVCVGFLVFEACGVYVGVCIGCVLFFGYLFWAWFLLC